MKVIYILILLVTTAWLGCSNSATVDSSINNPPGDLTGKITLTDFRGLPKTDKSGVLVQVDGTPYSAITDTDGVWTIYNLPSKVYSLTFSKDSCSTWKNRSYSFIGGATVSYKQTFFYNNTLFDYSIVPMRELPRYTIALDAILLPTSIYSDSLQSYVQIPGALYGHTSPDAPPSPLNTYIISGPKPTISIENRASYANFYWFNPTTVGYNFYSGSSRDTTVNLYLNSFPELLKKISSGDTVYFRAYPGIGNDSYYDPIEDRMVIIGISLNASNVLSAIVP